MSYHLSEQWFGHTFQIDQIYRSPGTLGQDADDGYFFVWRQRLGGSNSNVQIAIRPLATQRHRTKQYSKDNLRKMREHVFEQRIYRLRRFFTRRQR